MCLPIYSLGQNFFISWFTGKKFRFVIGGMNKNFLYPAALKSVG